MNLYIIIALVWLLILLPELKGRFLQKFSPLINLLTRLRRRKRD